MSNFGFGADPFDTTTAGSLAQQNVRIANIQRELPVDKTDEEEVTGGISAFTGIAQGQKGLRDVLEGVKKGKAAIGNGVQRVINTVQNGPNGVAQRGEELAQNARTIGGGAPRNMGNDPGADFSNPSFGMGQPETAHGAAGGPRQTADSNYDTILPEGEQEGSGYATIHPLGNRTITNPSYQAMSPNRTITNPTYTDVRPGTPTGGAAQAFRPTPTGHNLTDADGNSHSTPPPSDNIDWSRATSRPTPAVPGRNPRMNIGTILNGEAGDNNALGEATQGLTTGMDNLHARVQSGIDRISSLTAKVDAGLDTGISTAEGVLDAMGPVGDVMGLFTGIYGAIKAHRDKVEDQEHFKAQTQGLSNVAASANIPNTNVANVGRQTAGLTNQLQSVSAHF